jgi:hypothetical protein
MKTKTVMEFNRSGIPETVSAIVYRTLGPDGMLLPTDVFTSVWVDRSKLGKGYPPSSFYVRTYDFNWCKRFQSLYQHNSGAGGDRFYIHRIAEPNKPPRCALWWDHRFGGPTNGASMVKRILTANTIGHWGYNILDEPLRLFGGSANPFDHAIEIEGAMEFCAKCDDDLPPESLCEHIWWCEKCETYSTPQARCSHRRPKNV